MSYSRQAQGASRCQCVRACVRAWYLLCVFAAAASSTSSPLATTTAVYGSGPAVCPCPSPPPPPAKLTRSPAMWR